MGLAGLIAAALIGGVVAANPAEAHKKRKHGHHATVVQVSKGGNATAGNGGAGGSGGSSGGVNNTGAVLGGDVHSGAGGNGTAGGMGGAATGGAAGNNSNTSTVNVSSDNHSIDVDH